MNCIGGGGQSKIFELAVEIAGTCSLNPQQGIVNGSGKTPAYGTCSHLGC